MGLSHSPRIVIDGLVLALDAGNTKSYDASISPPIITYVGGTSESNDSNSFTLSGLQSGDLVLFFGAEDGEDLETPTSESWTAIPGLTTQPDNDRRPSSGAFYVFATGTSVTANNLLDSDEAVYVMIAFRNVDAANPFDVNATEVSGSGLPNPPSITPVTNNSMIVAVGFIDDEDIANTISPPTGYTTAVNMDSQGGANDPGLGGATIMTAYKLLATAASEDPDIFTSSNPSGGGTNKGISIALRPSPPNIWTDLIGSNNGTLIGPTFSSANGGYFDFDGNDDYVTTGNRLPDAYELFADTGNEWSTSSWFKIDATANSSKAITGRGGGTGASATYVVYLNGTSLKARLRGGTVTDISTSIASNIWYNVVVTWDGSTARGYLNGNFLTTIPVGTASNQTNTFTIGATASGNSNPFDGKISQTLVYKKSLTASEVLQNYNALKERYAFTPTLVQDGLVLNLDAGNTNSYPGSGTTWTDLSGNSNNGTLTNGPTYSSADGGSIVFDGTDDYVSETSGLSDSFLQGDWTISFWVNFDVISTNNTGRILLQHGSNSTRRGLHLEQRNSSLIFGLYGDDLGGSQTLSTGTWYNITFTLNSTTRLQQIFVNGFLDNSRTANGAYVGTGSNTRIGGRALNFSSYLDGKISNVVAYNRVLSAQEISQNYNFLKDRY